MALVDTLEQFPLDIQPFRDMIAGQRMDLHRNRYDTFEDLELYCYRVAGTVGLMSTTVMGIDTQLKTAPWARQSSSSISTQHLRRSPWALPTSSPTFCATWAKMPAEAASTYPWLTWPPLTTPRPI